MKKALLILLGAAALFAGCSKNHSKSSSSLAGTWYLKKDSSVAFANNAQVGQNVTLYTGENNYIMFNGDGSGGLYLNQGQTSSAYSETLTYKQASDNTVTITFPSQIINGRATTAVTRVETIQTLTETSLVLVYNSTIVSNGTTTTTSETQYFGSN